jgi:Acetyltransferase (GNAT) domain
MREACYRDGFLDKIGQDTVNSIGCESFRCRVGVGGPMQLDLKPVAQLSDDERAALKALTAAVYPPEVMATRPGRHFHWAPPDYSVLVSTPAGELVSHVGIVVRVGSLDGVPVKIGGIGSVKTHPRFEGRGYASAGLHRAATALQHDHHVAFSLLNRTS